MVRVECAKQGANQLLKIVNVDLYDQRLSYHRFYIESFAFFQLNPFSNCTNIFRVYMPFWNKFMTYRTAFIEHSQKWQNSDNSRIHGISKILLTIHNSLASLSIDLYFITFVRLAWLGLALLCFRESEK